MNAFLKDRYDMKSFGYVDLSGKLPDIQTETIKGKRFYVTPEGKNILQSPQFYQVEIMKD